MIEIVEHLDGLISLAGEWNELEYGFDTPLLSHAWFSACAKAFCPPQKLKMIIHRSGGELDAIAPIAASGKANARLEVLGSSIVGEPSGFLYKDSKALEEVFQAVLRLGLPLFIKGLNIASPEAEILEREIGAGRLQALVREERIPWVRVRGKWNDFEKSISSSRRSSFRRLQRLAEAKGEVRFEAAVPDLDNVDKYLDEAFAVEVSSWKGRKGTAMQSDRKLGEFFREYSREIVKSGRLRLFFLRVNGVAVAMGLTALHSNRLWVFKVGYDEAWSWCSPGILLMHQMVRHCFDTGLQGCEFLGADESWLHIWANESHSVATYRVYPGVFGGKVRRAGDLLQMSMNKMNTAISTRRAHKGRSRDAEHA